jgi:hypothetical protein
MGKKPAAKSEATATAKATKAKSVEVTAKPAKKVAAKAKSAEQSCKVASCKREYKAKGYCKAHYKKWRQGAFGLARYKTCGSLDCKKPMGTNRHGYCEEHFQNYYVKGVAVAKAPVAEKPATEKKEAAG